MGNLIIRHSGGLFFRSRKYLIDVDGARAGILTSGQLKMELELPAGVYVITIADKRFSVIETIQITGDNKTLYIYPSASQKAIDIGLVLMTLAVLTTFFLFLKNGESSTQLLILVILVPFYLVILTSRKKSSASFMVFVS